jgi:deoxycytidylate deaminase
MYMAKAAALRSLDLSRQVGAAIFTKEGEIITLGCNEVPKGGGGTYWTEDKFDDRDYRRGEDPNDRIKKNNVLELLERLNKKHLKQTKNTLVEIVNGDAVSESRIMDALEFGRIIHAEMSAITDAARLGRSTRNATLFCTTFPCHICVKHIVSSGISCVYFLEPYPKSHAYELHSDSLKVEGAFTAEHESYPKTEFLHFSGVAPRRYRDLFERSKRKRGGKFREWIDTPERPMFTMKYPLWCSLEEAVVEKLRELGFSSTIRRLRAKRFGVPAALGAPPQ